MKSGVTLIELLITVTLISILTSVTLPVTRTAGIRVREYELKRSLRVIRRAIDEYRFSSQTEVTDSDEDSREAEEGKKYPSSLKVLVEEGYLRRIPTDPFTKPREGENSNWVVISSSGREEDVWDIQSGSRQTSLGGEPYERW